MNITATVEKRVWEALAIASGKVEFAPLRGPPWARYPAHLVEIEQAAILTCSPGMTTGVQSQLR